VLGNFDGLYIPQSEFYQRVLLHIITLKSSKLPIFDSETLFYPKESEFLLLCAGFAWQEGA